MIYNLLTATGATITLTVNHADFVLDQEYYTMTMTFTCGEDVSRSVYRITRLNDQDDRHIPCVRIATAGDANQAGPLAVLTEPGDDKFIDMEFACDYGFDTTKWVITRISHNNTFTNDPFYNASRFACGPAVNSYDHDITGNLTIEADFPVFAENYGEYTPYAYVGTAYAWNDLATADTYVNEVNNNDITHINQAINFTTIDYTIPVNTVWTIHNYLKKNGSIIQSKNYDFRIQPGAKIALYVNDQIEGDATANMILRISASPWEQKASNAPESAYVETSVLDDKYWWGMWQNYQNGDSYVGYGSTNIPMYRSAQEVQDYFDGKIGIEDSINGGDSSIQTSTIGDYMTSTDIPTVTLASSGIGCFVYALSAAELEHIMENYLFTDNASLQQTIKDALWTWGNNPIDFMIDCYYVPFSITPFYDTITANLKFGTYQFAGTSYNVVKESNGDRLTLFNTTFEGIYGDWRDYTQFSYDLFLPFIGFVPLDVQKYLNHNVRCEMMFDLTTHNVRYYLFVDDLITDRFDGSVGVNIPLMASDTVNKAKHDRDIKYGLATGALNTAGSLASSLTSPDPSKAMGGIISSAGNIIGMVKQYQELGTKESSGVEGAFSSAMNVYDVSYAYLRITESQTIIPQNTNALYNYPSYYMGNVSSLSGYCELADIRFSSTATQPEIEEIQSLLRSGVIL